MWLQLMGTPEMRNWHTTGWAFWMINDEHDGYHSGVPRVDFYK